MFKSTAAIGLFVLLCLSAVAQDSNPGEALNTRPDSAFFDGRGPGWRSLGENDFVNVNCSEDTWTWKNDSVSCTGQPVGVTRTKKVFTNFEMVCEWRHLRDAGNSGIFIWAPIETFDRLDGPGLPEGIEIQVLDLGYKSAYEKSGNPANWFTCHGDVFPVGSSTMKPFPPISPNGRRSFPTEERSLGVEEWNHYYIRAINGEIRLWVNGAEVSGGSACDPSTGHVALESEGSPVEFRNLRIRELP